MVRREILVIWIIAVGIVSPYMNTLSVKRGICHTWDWTRIQVFIYYAVYINLCSFIPAIVIICIYTKSIYLLARKEIPGSEDKTLSAKRKKEFLKIMQMFSCIAIVFFMLTMPYMVVHFISSYYGTFDVMTFCENSKLLMSLQYGFYTLAHFNCCVNPFIYANMHRNMKRTLMKHFNKRLTYASFRRKISTSLVSIQEWML